MPVRFNNPLAYPNGIRPGFNQAHPAAGKIVRYSGVATGATMVNLLNARRATASGTIAAAMDGRIGPAIGASTSSSFLSMPGINETPLAVTFGAIVTPTGTSPTFGFMFNNDSAANTGFYIGALTPKLLVSNTAIIVASFNLTAGTPFFIAVSFNNATVNFVGVNLVNGQSFTTHGSNATPIAATTGAQYGIGGTGAANQSMVANLAAVMYSINNFLSDRQLLAWAQNPWDFWYPPTLRNVLSMAGKGVKPPIDLAGNLGGVSQYG